MKSIYSIAILTLMSALVSLTATNIVRAVEGQGYRQTAGSEQTISHIDFLVKPPQFTDRDDWQKPDEVVKSLHLKPGDVIADIGAGDGYFTKRFAKAVSPGGQALGLEISSTKVERMRRDAERSGLNSYKATLIEHDDAGLEPGSVDIVFLCNTYHHLSNRVEYFKKLSPSLKKNGRVVIVDFYKKKMPVGPSSSDHKLAKEVVLEEFQEAGYKLLNDKDFLPYQYYLEFGL